jgi:hypothetical protein
MPSQYSYLHLQMVTMFPSTTKTPGEQALEVWYPKRRSRQSRWRLSLFSVRPEYSTLRLYGHEYPPDTEQRSFYLCFIREFLWWIVNVTFSSLIASQRSTCCTSYTYLLTPLSRVLLEKLTGSQLVKKFPPILGKGRFIAAFVTAPHHLSLSWARSIQNMSPSHFFWFHFFITVCMVYDLYAFV